MGYSKTKVKELQKAHNSLDIWPKCGKLKENGLLDLDTQNTITEFVTACKQHKLMDLFKKDPRNTYVLINFITSYVIL